MVRNVHGEKFVIGQVMGMMGVRSHQRLPEYATDVSNHFPCLCTNQMAYSANFKSQTLYVCH